MLLLIEFPVNVKKNLFVNLPNLSFQSWFVWIITSCSRDYTTVFQNCIKLIEYQLFHYSTLFLFIVKIFILLPYNNYLYKRSIMILKVFCNIKSILLKMYCKKNFYSVQFEYLNYQINLQSYTWEKKHYFFTIKYNVVGKLCM